MLERSCDVLVVGGGPAGLAAAARAAEAGRTVALADDNPAPGGQIWRADTGRLAAAARPWAERLRAAGAEVLAGTAVVHAEGPGVLYGDAGGEPIRIAAGRLVLATGARERFLPFPGWTLPGVFGAGGLQALAKGGWPVDGRRVAVVGSGPLLPAVAAALSARGAKIVCVAEQAPFRRLAAFAAGLAARPRKLVQLVGIERALVGVPRWFSTWPVRVTGSGRAERLTLRSRPGRERTVACDAVACGFGLVPDTRLAALLGCRLDGGRVAVDPFQATSVDGVYCAGEPTGVGGVDLALAEGEIAGLAAADRRDEARGLFRRRGRERRFAESLDRAFALSGELRGLADDDTVVCRCEDTTWGEIRGAVDFRDAKLRTRCGMGPCQGRVCGPALEHLCGFAEAPPRPPLFPVSMRLWAELPEPSPEAKGART